MPKPDDELLLRWWWCSVDKLFNQFPQVLNLEGESMSQFRVVLNTAHNHFSLWILALVILFPLFLLGVFFPCMARTRQIPIGGQFFPGHILELLLMDKGMEGILGAWRR